MYTYEGSPEKDRTAKVQYSIRDGPAVVDVVVSIVHRQSATSGLILTTITCRLPSNYPL